MNYDWRSNMTLGAKIKEIRIQKSISVDELSARTGISRATLYRYENASIKKIPVDILEKICSALEILPTELINESNTSDNTLPESFNNPQDALAFILKTPSLAAYGGYDLSKMDDNTILEFANEILAQIKLVSYKYR